MTKIESLMLAISFGAVMGQLIANIGILLKYWRENRKLKKKLEDKNYESN
nr:MAG TPA: Glycophorin A [Caudoviricetes sp.]